MLRNLGILAAAALVIFLVVLAGAVIVGDRPAEESEKEYRTRCELMLLWAMMFLALLYGFVSRWIA